ncbi:LOW QUALITY PROTEIN: ral guanine nucleotide dissociation stimulator-like 2 [Heteronotia binoei]|uniref:LOW QUALITY PROTEIN: ral guanine nucleotide dissociation stimulator-like 2 n=1 Tax=Heteronotia binoei TaxID=13085 RepID=UPI0029306975|nr:LOW QUALITY PROTEIN: ral guanine nucleotide dissociation stimulator-like 2 [Heteronotia binoei]
MKVFLRLWGLPGSGGGRRRGVLLTRTRWYCLPAKAPVTLWEEAGDGVIYAVSRRASGGASGPVEGSSVGVSGGPLRGGGWLGCGFKILPPPPPPPLLLLPGSLGLRRARRRREEAAASAPLECPLPPGQSRALKAASLPGLVRHLLEAPALGDPCFVPAFLATYRTFAAPRLVLGTLLDRLRALEDPGSDLAPERTQLQRALGSLLCSWLDGYPEDFVGLEPRLREQLLDRLRWALGRGSEHEKSLAPAPKEEAPGTRGEPEGEEAAVEDQDANPHYILGLQADEVAAYLTAQDAELFLHLVPHECLGSLWSQRDKKGNEGACPTVRATVAQFNRVANAVVASCLSDTGLRATQRARLLEKWIRVAEECLSLRNFSSLYAVVSALQSTPLHRLKRTWEETSRDCIHCYGELSAICSEKDNYRQSRQLLFQEGSPNPEPTQRRHQRKTLEQRPTGVVPYLGTFLKDLVMLDAATRNRLENGYINFEKHRKEFEILTQLRLLQAACRNYTLRPDRTFQRWLESRPRLTETQSYQLSCAIEPLGEGGTPTRSTKPSVVITHCTDMLSSIGMGVPVSWDKPSSPQGSPDLLLSPAPALAQHTKWPSVSVLDRAPEDDGPSSPEGLAPPPPARGGSFIRGHRRSASCGSANPTAPKPGCASASECRFIRVRMELQNGTLYKSVVVTSQDKAPAVIAKVLEKHNQDRGLAPDYELVQLLGEGRELAFPPIANIFYAMNSSSLDFVLRRKRSQDSASPPVPPPRTPRGTDAHATFPKIKATGRKITKAFF